MKLREETVMVSHFKAWPEKSVPEEEKSIEVLCTLA